MARGVDRRAICIDKRDYEAFLNRLNRIIEETGATVLAYCLMPNHFHLAIKVGPVSLSAIMQRILASHATTFNRRYGRTGHLFEARHRAYLCSDDRYLLALIRYIQLNPVRAELVSRAEDWPWSSRVPIGLPDLEMDEFEPWPTIGGQPILMRSRETNLTLDEIGENVGTTTGFGPIELRSGTKNSQVVRAKALLAREGIRNGHRIGEIASWLHTAPGSVGYYLRKNSTNLRT